MKEVQLEFNGHTFDVGMIEEDFIIGANRRGRQTVPVYDNRIVDYICEMARKRVQHRFDARILISGPVRTGKSTLACAIARQLNPSFTEDLVAFKLEDFTVILSSLQPADPDNGFYPVAILDESGTALYNKDWQLRLVKQMAKIYQVIGKKNLTMIMCLPHRSLLTKDIREQMHIWINTRTDLDGERGFAELREGIENIWKLELYWKPVCAFCFDELSGTFWRNYETRKDAFIAAFVAEKPEDIMRPPPRVQEALDQRNAAIRLVAKNKKLSQVAIAEAVGTTVDVVHKAINRPTTDP